MGNWEKIVFADECHSCDCCEEPFCVKHEMHYWECDCIGPTEDEVEYHEDGVHARRIPEDQWG